MLGGLHLKDSLTISSLQCKAGRASHNRNAFYAGKLRAFDANALCLQGGDVHKMVGSLGTTKPMRNCSIPRETAWASRDRRPHWARMPGAPDLQTTDQNNDRPFQALLASYFTRSKPSTSEISLFTSFPLSLLR